MTWGPGSSPRVGFGGYRIRTQVATRISSRTIRSTNRPAPAELFAAPRPAIRGRAYLRPATADDRLFNHHRRLVGDGEREAEGRAGARRALELDRAAVSLGDDL